LHALRKAQPGDEIEWDYFDADVPSSDEEAEDEEEDEEAERPPAKRQRIACNCKGSAIAVFLPIGGERYVMRACPGTVAE
jgi:hypothetical protein